MAPVNADLEIRKLSLKLGECAMLNQRLISGGLFGGAFLVAIFFLPAFCAGPVMMALVGFSLWEFYGMLAQAGVPSFRVIGTVTGMAWIGMTTLGALVPAHLPPFLACGESELFLLALLVMGVCVRIFPQKNNGQPLMTLACTIFGVLYVAFFLNYILKIVLMWDTPVWSAPIGRTGARLCLIPGGGGQGDRYRCFFCRPFAGPAQDVPPHIAR